MQTKKPKITKEERITKYLEATPGAIAYQGGHDRTFAVACSLYNGWDLTEDETLSWLKVYNTKCDPQWSDKELERKARESTKAGHDKPRGYLVGESGAAFERKPPDWTLPTKPLGAWQFPTTLTTLNSNLRVYIEHTETLSHTRDIENTVVNVVKPTPTSLADPQKDITPALGLVSQLHRQPPQAETEAAQAPEYSTTPIPEVVDHFVEDVVIRENGALCAFHYLFDRYRKWRASYGLLASQFDQAQFAAEMQSHGVSTNFERKLFLGIYAPFETKDQDAQSIERGKPASC